VNAYSKVDLEECKEDENCYQMVWDQILQRIGDPARNRRGYGLINRMSGLVSGAHKIFPRTSHGRNSRRGSKSGVESEVILNRDR
jgi:hypothetical protein